MTIEHSAIVSANCHEPKHISDATTGDAGKVITPDSTTSGTSILRLLKLEELDFTTVPHINLNIIANTTPVAVTAAVDGTLHTSSDYSAITQFTEDTGYAKVGFTFNAGTGQITVPETGVYRMSLWLSITSDAVNSVVGLRFGVGGNYFPVASPVLKVEVVAASEIQSLSAMGEYSMTASDVLTIGLACSKTANITVHEAGLVLRRIA